VNNPSSIGVKFGVSRGFAAYCGYVEWLYTPVDDKVRREAVTQVRTLYQKHDTEASFILDQKA
jgi:hypothetical protein